MTRLLVLPLLLASVGGRGVVGQVVDRTIQPSCIPYSYTCGPITPSPSPQYAAQMETVIMNENETRYEEEFYDYNGQVLALTLLSDKAFTHAVFYYAIDTAVIMVTPHEVEDGSPSVTCYAGSILDSNWVTPWFSNNGSLEVLAPYQALFFGNQYKYTYINNENSRDIPCNRWDACIPVTNDTFFEVKYQWMDPTRTVDMFEYPNERPVSAIVTGQYFLPGDHTTPLVLEKHYSFSLFDDNPDMDDIKWAFEIPSNVYCPGLPTVKAPPSQMSRTFSLRVEVAMQSSPTGPHELDTTAMQWYDYDRRYTRTDTLPAPGSPEAEVAGFSEVSIIRDYSNGVEYVVDRWLGNCTTMVIPNDTWSAITTPDGSVSIKDPMALFGMTENANLTYYGIKYARGLPCDVWMGHLDAWMDNITLHDSFLYELYFLKAGWREDAGAIEDPHKAVPILVKIQQDMTTPIPTLEFILDIEENIFKYEEEEPNQYVYDITACFSGHDHIRRFQMAFPGIYRYDYVDRPAYFIVDVTTSLAMALLIPQIRIQHPLIEFSEEDGKLYYEFTLVDQPQIPNVDFPGFVGDPLPEVVVDLQRVMDSFVVILYSPDYNTQGHIKMMKPYNDSLKEMYESDCTPMFEASHPDSPNSPHSEKTLPRSQSRNEEQIEISKEKSTTNYQDRKKTAATERKKLVMSRNERAEVILSGPDETQKADGEDREEHALPDGGEAWVGREKLRPFHSALRYWLGRGRAAVTAANARSNKEKTYSPGAMAGMGVGMFLTGLLLGVLFMLIALSKFGLADGIELIPMSFTNKKT